MKLIDSYVEIVEQRYDGDLLQQMYKHIELCGKTCYKSESNITEQSYEPFIKMIREKGHYSVFEHGTLYLCIPADSSLSAKYESNPYSVVVREGDTCFITTNYRVVVEKGWEDDLQFLSIPQPAHHKRFTFRFVCDRGVTHELVRSRVLSFSQESTRYCNYMQSKFGTSVTFIQPDWVKSEDQEAFEADLQLMESLYFKYLNKGYAPQEARYFLPNGVKTEICVTGFEEQWKQFLDLRYWGKAGKPHPDMLKVAADLLKLFEEKTK